MLVVVWHAFKRSLYYFPFVILGSVLYFVVFTADHRNAIASDYLNLTTGATLVKEGKASFLYNADIQFQLQKRIAGSYADLEFLLPFRSMGFFALVLAPFAYLGLGFGYKIYLILMIAIVFIIFLLSLKYFSSAKKNVFFPALILLYPATIESFKVAQYIPIVGLILLVLYKLLKDKKYYYTGIVAGIILVKIQYIVLLPFIIYMIKNRGEFIKGFLLSALLLIIVSVLVTGVEGLIQYPSFLFNTEVSTFGSRPNRMFTLFALLQTRTGLANFTLLLFNAFFYFVFLIIFAKSSKRIGFELGYAAAVIFSLVFSVHSLLHDLIILVIPLLILLNLSYKKKYKKVSRNLRYFVAILFVLPFLDSIGIAPLGSLVLLSIGLFLLNISKVAPAPSTIERNKAK